MKAKVILTLVTTILFSQTFAAVRNTGEGNGDDEKNGLKTDSAKVETVFEMNFEESSESLEVFVSGDFNEFASVAITTVRGSEIIFEFVESGENSFHFDLSQLDKGSYFLVLNLQEEIRIKRFTI